MVLVFKVKEDGDEIAGQKQNTLESFLPELPKYKRGDK